jgi:hypothetical protein
MGQLKSSHLLSDGSRKGAFLVAKEFALQERSGNRGAIHHDERPLFAAAQLMDGARHQFLAGTRFPLDEDCCVRRSHYLDVSENGLKRGAFANHIASALVRPDLFSQIGFDAVPDGIQQGFIIDRFCQKVCRACSDRADSHGDVPVAGEEYDGDLRA